MYGQLGLGDINNRGNSPDEMGNNLPEVDLGIDFNVTHIVAGGDHTCAVSQSNAIKCWGMNNYGQLGLGDMKTRGNRTNDMGDNLLEVDLGSPTLSPTESDDSVVMLYPYILTSILIVLFIS
eukprot:508688_1